MTASVSLTSRPQHIQTMSFSIYTSCEWILFRNYWIHFLGLNASMNRLFKRTFSNSPLVAIIEITVEMHHLLLYHKRFSSHLCESDSFNRWRSKPMWQQLGLFQMQRSKMLDALSVNPLLCVWVYECECVNLIVLQHFSFTNRIIKWNTQTLTQHTKLKQNYFNHLYSVISGMPKNNNKKALDIHSSNVCVCVCAQQFIIVCLPRRNAYYKILHRNRCHCCLSVCPARFSHTHVRIYLYI